MYVLIIKIFSEFSSFIRTSESIGFIGRQEGIAAMVSTAIQIENTETQ